ncbi:MAG TPA: flagellar basal body P-ring protein FlgI [bacterium]|nr:flagellar basal body P-ring protein FlgI [bacterium]
MPKSRRQRPFCPIPVRVWLTAVLALPVVAALAADNPGRSVCLRDISYVLGPPVTVSGYGVVVGLPGTGDGAVIPHTDVTFAATLRHLGIALPDVPIPVGTAAAVFVQAEICPGVNPGAPLPARVVALGDATTLAGGTLLPVDLHSPDGQFHMQASGAIDPAASIPCGLSPATAWMNQGAVAASTCFMTAVPERDFILEARGLADAQLPLLAERINAVFGQIARAHSGCDIEINLPPAYASFDERVSLIAQLAALPVDDLLPRILAEGPVP